MKTIQFFVLILAIWACSPEPTQKMDLSGEWQFKIDGNRMDGWSSKPGMVQ